MKKRKFFLLPICLLLLGACNLNQPSSQAKASEPEASSPTEESSAPHEHQFGEWVETTAPTCTEKAVETRTCSCGATETRDGRDALGHDFGGEDAWTITTRPTCTEKGQESRKCSRCDATEKRDADALGHKWDDGVVTTVPTAENKGVKTFTCTRSGCNATKTEEIDKVQGITVTFVQGAHFTLKIYKTKAYDTETPTEAYTCYARDENGNAIDYDASASLQPQVNFKIECETGYSVGVNDIKIVGTDGTTDKDSLYKNIKQGPNTADGLPDEQFFRITKIQKDLTITITPINGEQKIPEATFITNHCSVVFYKTDTISEDNIDNETTINPRDDNGAVAKSGGQINFKVIPEAGYKWDHGVTASQVGVETLPFIALGSEGAAKNFKVVDATNNVYKITKVNGDISVLINCIPEAGEADKGYEVTFVTEHCHVLVYQTQDYQFTPTAPVDGKVLSRLEDGTAAKHDLVTPGVDLNGDGKYDGEGESEPVYLKPQVNFLVVCDEGYEFNSGVEAGKDAKASKISFVTGTYNKFKNVGDGIYRITVIESNLTINIVATAKAAA